MERLIENRRFAEGLRLENARNVRIRGCMISNVSGRCGLELVGCRDVTVEDCTIRRVGNESEMYRTQRRNGFEFFLEHDPVTGVLINDCFGITLVNNEITDIFGRGIRVTARSGDVDLDLHVEGNRLAYLLDDGIYLHTPSDQDDDICSMPLRGVRIIRNMLHDIGLGLTRLPFARHGMYLKCRDVLVESNTLYNCFYGQAISLRNAGIVRGNHIRNSMGGIAYWAQTRTQDSSRRITIESNQIQQDFAFDFPMRHIENPKAKRHGHPEFPGIVIQYSADERKRINRIEVIKNRITVRSDYEASVPLITGSGSPRDRRFSLLLQDNRFDDERVVPNVYDHALINCSQTSVLQ